MDTLRVEANERVDYGDFNYAVAEALETAIRQQGELFLANPLGAVRSWILSGFAMTNPTAKQLVVTLGRALLSARIDGQLQHGFIAAEGDLTKIIDMGPLAPTNYNVYLRFEIVDGDSSSRIFWDPAGSGSEFASTIATRRKANWSIRVETSNPGPEWVQIGTADNTGVNLVLVDQRKFYFEGTVPSTYQSGWSTDGGGGANDRNADRRTYGVQDLQTFTAATRQCLEDIKGRGLRRWWSRDIGGMNIGFDAAPVEDRLAIGDAEFYWENASPYLLPGIRFATTGGVDSWVYDRSNNWWQWGIAGTEEMRLSAAGLAVTNGLYVGDPIGVPVDNEIYAQGAIHAGTYLHSDSGRVYLLGVDDYMAWDHTNWSFVLDGIEEARIRASGLNVTNGLYVGDVTTAPTDDEVRAAGAIRAGTDLWTANGNIYCGATTASYINHTATGGNMYCAGAGVMWWTAAGLVSIYGGLHVGSGSAPIDNEIAADGRVTAGSYVQATSYLKAGSYLQVGAASAGNNGDGIFGRGLVVGFDATPADNEVQVGDANFGLRLVDANNVDLRMSSTALLRYERASNRFAFYVNGSFEMYLDAGALFPGASLGLNLGGSGNRWNEVWGSTGIFTGGSCGSSGTPYDPGSVQMLGSHHWYNNVVAWGKLVYDGVSAMFLSGDSYNIDEANCTHISDGRWKVQFYRGVRGVPMCMPCSQSIYIHHVNADLLTSTSLYLRLMFFDGTTYDGGYDFPTGCYVAVVGGPSTTI